MMSPEAGQGSGVRPDDSPPVPHRRRSSDQGSAGIGGPPSARQIRISDYDSDKPATYLPQYCRVFADLMDRELTLLELGVLRAGSLLLWRDMFPRAEIVGLDLQPVTLPDDCSRIHIYQGPQQDTALLDRIAYETAPQGFDIILDDASHIARYTSASFWHLFRHHLKPGGIYVIEDWGSGYWPSWPDGRRYNRSQLARLEGEGRPRHENAADGAGTKVRSMLRRLPRGKLRAALKNAYYRWKLLPAPFPSHDAGMVGFVKQLVDATAMEDITRPDRGIEPFRRSMIAELRFTCGQVFVFKRVAGKQ
jgi:hypothetical protein